MLKIEAGDFMLYINYLSNEKNTPPGVKKYIVMRMAPKSLDFSKRPDLIYRQDLSPSEYLLKQYKSGKISLTEMQREFIKEMNTRPDLNKALNEVIADIKTGKDICLICVEEDSDECHRKLEAEYVKAKIEEEHKEDPNFVFNYIDLKKIQIPKTDDQISIFDF